jgi:hypothetical protein
MQLPVPTLQLSRVASVTMDAHTPFLNIQNVQPEQDGIAVRCDVPVQTGKLDAAAAAKPGCAALGTSNIENIDFAIHSLFWAA